MWISTIVLFTFIHQGISQSWSYADQDAWGSISRFCTEGTNQSPIDLRSNVVGPNDGRPNIQFLNYKATPKEVIMINNGHSIQTEVTWAGELKDKPRIKAPYALSNEEYIFHNVHFHWSNDDNNGTEHSVRGKKFASELHMVHYNSKYPDFNTAFSSPDGVAIFTIFLEVNDTVAPNLGVQQLVLNFPQVINPGNRVPLRTIDLSAFLPKTIGPFYSYHGAPTTPPCRENTRWIILQEPDTVTSQIMQQLRSIILNPGNSPNIRPILPQNNRLIEYYK